MSEIIIIKDIQIKISTFHRLVVLDLQSSYWLVILAVNLNILRVFNRWRNGHRNTEMPKLRASNFEQPTMCKM